jgi:hypothetical protein
LALGNAATEPELLIQNNESEAEFLIPANQTHQEEMRFELNQAESRIWAIGGWMHWAGKEMSISLECTDSTCLVILDDWQPDWMRLYRYDPATDYPLWSPQNQLQLQCTYENTSHNEDLMEMLSNEGVDEIKDRQLGPGPQDESCLALVGILQPNL